MEDNLRNLEILGKGYFHDIEYLNMQLEEMSQDFGIYFIKILENMVERS